MNTTVYHRLTLEKKRGVVFEGSQPDAVALFFFSRSWQSSCTATWEAPKPQCPGQNWRLKAEVNGLKVKNSTFFFVGIPWNPQILRNVNLILISSYFLGFGVDGSILFDSFGDCYRGEQS